MLSLRAALIFVIGVLALSVVCHVIYRVLRYVFQSLTSPSQEPIITDINGVYYPVSYWTVKGGRPYQEDRHHELKGSGAPDSSLYAVFDGHGGARAAQYCKDHLLKAILCDTHFSSDISTALDKSFHRYVINRQHTTVLMQGSIDADFIELGKQSGALDGTTATVAVVHDGVVIVGNAGDSRCIMVQRGGKIIRQDEEKRIRDLGGRVLFWGRWRVEGVLAMSRAIGDASLKPFVTCAPEITTRKIEDDDCYLVLATDGLWDVMNNEEVAAFVVKCHDFKHIARDLCDEATLLGSTDNITVLVVDLK